MDFDKIILSLNNDRNISTLYNGEKRLWGAVLEDAFEEIGLLHPRKYRKYISFRMWKQTRDWILDKDNHCRNIGSFDWILHVLDIPKKRLREFLYTVKCSCCDHILLSRPCKSVVKKEPKNAAKYYCDPKFWVNKKNRIKSKKLSR